MTHPADPHRWTRIVDLFERARSVRPEDRAAWLIAVCGDDDDLHEAVSSLLRVEEGAADRTGEPSAPDAARTARPRPALQVRTLRARLADGPLPLVDAVEAALAIARAAAAAHARGVVCLDVTPDNVVGTPDGGFELFDSGSARALPDAPVPLADAGATPGTVAYLAPEQIRGHRVDARGDQFAIGVVLYELVTGGHPFVARTPAATLARMLGAAAEPLDAQLAESRPAGGHVIDRIDGIVMRCLQKQPDQRFADTAALVAALERLHAIVAPPPPRSEPDGRARTWWQVHQAAVTMGYLLLLVPLWRVGSALDDAAAAPLLLAGSVAALIAVVLRLRAWIALAHAPDRHRPRRRDRRSIVTADLAFALVLLTAGGFARAGGLTIGLLLVAAAVVVVVLSLAIEPAADRAERRP